MGHFVLDVVGVVPGFGMLADAGNALWYWAEGNNEMAYYSLAAIAGGSAAVLYVKYGAAVTKMTAKMIVNGSDKLAARTNKFFGATDEVLSSADDVAKQADEVVERVAKGGASSFNRGVAEAFSNHAFARGRHYDLGLSIDVMTEKSMSLIESNFTLLKSGDNTLIGNINGVEKTFKAFVQNGVVMSINMYSGTSNRVTAGNIIYLGDLVW